MSIPSVELKSLKLTPAGQDWLTIALDPFHDFKSPLAGYPDANSALSLCECYTQSVTIDAPAACAGNWDCEVANLPISCEVPLTGSPFDAGSIRSANIQSTPPQAVSLAPLMIHAADAGQALWPNSSIATWAPTNFEQTNLYSVPNPHPCFIYRVIAQGFEVHNTTAEVYRQGTVTVGCVPQSPTFGFRAISDDDAVLINTPNLTLEFESPPTTAAQAILNPRAIQWEASKGVYSVCTLADVHNPARCLCASVPMAHTGRQHGYAAASYGIASTLQTVAAIGSFGPGYHITGFNTNYAYFTGLSNQTSLTITFKTYVEFFPRAGDAIYPLATQSPPLDLAALEIYGTVINSIAPGVPVDMNAKGDWFRNVLRFIKPFAAVIPKYGVPASLAIETALKLLGPGGDDNKVQATAKQLKKLQKRGKKREPATQTFV